MTNNSPCNAPANAPADYCVKLRGGIGRLRAQIEALYHDSFPKDWIQRAVAEAEERAWQTPFPSLFFTALAHAHITKPQLSS